MACYALFILLSMGAITHAGLFAVLCVPHGHEVWDFKLMMRCGTGAPVTVAVGVCTLFIDIAIFILPFPIIANLNMDKNKKRGLFIVFLIGFAYVLFFSVSLSTFWKHANNSISCVASLLRVLLDSLTELLS